MSVVKCGQDMKRWHIIWHI